MITLNDTEVIQLLRDKKINITQPRIHVLRVIYSDCPPVFEASEILKFAADMNRVSIHRILKLFVKKKILDTIPNTKAKVEYALSSKLQRLNNGQKLYKFICEKCGSIMVQIH